MIGGEIIMNEKENLRLLWRKRVKDFRVSGLSMKEYSKENNIKIHQLQYWNQKYKGDNKKVLISIVNDCNILLSIQNK